MELKIELYGRVQGVQFRHFVKASADKLGLNGYVKNREDGNLIALAQGNEKVLRKFLGLLEVGPQLAKVEGVSYFWQEEEKRYNGFEILVDKGFIKDQSSSFINLGKKLLNIKSKIPLHIAIIPDGNRRWARKKGIGETVGYSKVAYDNVIKIAEEAQRCGVKYLTFWAFSSDNWKRSLIEINFLFNLFEEFMEKQRFRFIRDKIRFRHLGRKDRLPPRVLKKIKELEELTKDFTDFNVQLCIDYGGRDEISRAVNKILKSGVKEIKEGDIERYLDSSGIPDPDLIIRTSGEKRTSGFMPFQSAYTELYFADIYFPDFGSEDLRDAIKEFANRRRRLGK